MATTTKFYGLPVVNLFDGTQPWDWNTDPIYVALTLAAHTPDQDTHDFYADLTNELTTTGGYTVGGQAIVSPTVTYDSATDQIKLDCTDPAWTSASFTARNAHVYKNSGSKPLILYMVFDADKTVSSGTFTIQLDTLGMGYADVS